MPRTLQSRIAAALLLAAALLPLPAFAQEPAAPAGAEAVNDPLEPFNRGVFWFNEAVDRALIEPASRVYRAVVPDPLKTGLRNVLQNLRSPLTIANQALQGDWEGTQVALQRFVINSTVGIGGLIDVAGAHGIPYEYESFDQTLAVWGVPEGPYLVLPLLGPSTVRDAAGFGTEFLADPVGHYVDGRAWDTEFTYSRVGVTVLDTRAGYIDAIDDLRRNSFDYYAAMRSLYRQRRDGWIRDGKEDPNQMPDIPDFDQE